MQPGSSHYNNLWSRRDDSQLAPLRNENKETETRELVYRNGGIPWEIAGSRTRLPRDMEPLTEATAFSSVGLVASYSGLVDGARGKFLCMCLLRKPESHF